MAIYKFLDLCNSHIKETTAKYLDEATDPEEQEYTPFRVLKYEYGWIVFVQPELDDEEYIYVPPDLLAVIKYAIDQDCFMIRFDRDAEKIDELKTFNW